MSHVVSPKDYDALVRAGFVKDGKIVAWAPAQVALLRMKEYLKTKRGNT